MLRCMSAPRYTGEGLHTLIYYIYIYVIIKNKESRIKSRKRTGSTMHSYFPRQPRKLCKELNRSRSFLVMNPSHKETCRLRSGSTVSTAHEVVRGTQSLMLSTRTTRNVKIYWMMISMVSEFKASDVLGYIQVQITHLLDSVSLNAIDVMFRLMAS